MRRKRSWTESVKWGCLEKWGYFFQNGDTKMQRFFFLGTLLTTMTVLTGCVTPVLEEETVPPIVSNEIDSVHVREVSTEFYGKSRAGAAVRSAEMAHVLYGQHYDFAEGEIPPLPIVKKTQKPVVPVVTKQAKKSPDASIYARKMKEKKDASVYAKKQTQRSIKSK